jgi:hypothetical protein
MAARKTSRCEKDVTMGWLCGQRTPIELKWRQAQRYEPSFRSDINPILPIWRFLLMA